MNLSQIHKHSSFHQQELLLSNSCGCFYCLKVFKPFEIKSWTDSGQTALCPYCGIDSILGNYHLNITQLLLKEMNEEWFGVSKLKAKINAVNEAIKYVEDGMTIGLGSGTTSYQFIELLAKKNLNIIGVPTSLESEKIAKSFGIKTKNINDVEFCDIAFDGADEVDNDLNLIKGLGGAHLREKIIAQNSDRFIIMIDNSKLVNNSLGEKCPVPVEVMPFAHEKNKNKLINLGANVTLRVKNNVPVLTDNNNFIYDCYFKSIKDASQLNIMMESIAGVVGTGLFINMANDVIVGSEDSVRHIRAK